MVHAPDNAKIFRKSQLVVIRQGHKTKRVKNGWQADQKSMKVTDQNAERWEAASKDHNGEEDQVAGAFDGP